PPRSVLFPYTTLFRSAFQSEAEEPGSIFEPAYAKGGLEFFRYVEDGRMAYVGSVRDDTKTILGREPLLLREWAKLHANELRLRVDRKSTRLNSSHQII